MIILKSSDSFQPAIAGIAGLSVREFKPTGFEPVVVYSPFSKVVFYPHNRSDTEAPAGRSHNMLWLRPAGAIFQALGDLFIICYTLFVKKKVPIRLAL